MEIENQNPLKEVLRELSFFLKNMRNSLNDDKLDGTSFVIELKKLEEFSTKIQSQIPKIDKEKNGDSDRHLLEINQTHRKQINNFDNYQKILMTEKSM